MSPDSARIAVLASPAQDFEIRRYPLPRPGPGEILVRVICCTICGSDIHSWSGRRPTPLPVVLGHEIVGEIAELGAGVDRDAGDRPLSAGDRITWTLTDSCGRCFYCRQKKLPMKCRRLKKYGHERCDIPPHFSGGFADYCLITSGTCVIRLPDEVTETAAAPANCALATVAAGWEAAGIQPMESVLILGAGALGIYAAALADAAGCKPIVVLDVENDRLEFIRAFGATDVIDVSEVTIEAAAAAVGDITKGAGVDCVMEVAGAPDLIGPGLDCLRTGGRLIEIGCSFPGAVFAYDAAKIVWRRLTITGVHNYDVAHLQRGVDFLDAAREKYPFESIVAAKFALTDINAAIQTAAEKKAPRVAVIP